MAKGKIKTYLEEKGFGFISPEKGGDDVFFHVNELNDRGYGVEPGAPVEYDTKPGRNPGEVKAVRVRVLDFAPESPPERPREASSARSSATPQTHSLPSECVFQSFYAADGGLEPRIFYDAAQKAADLFRRSGLKSTQFRQLYQGFLSFAGPLRDHRLDFVVAKERFGAFYVERVVRQTERKVLPPVVKGLIDAHRELAVSDREQMLALFRYLKNIYCYFGESDNKN